MEIGTGEAGRRKEGRRREGSGSEADASKLVCVGVITGAHGIKGHVRIKSFTAEPGDVGRYGSLSGAGGEAPLRVTVTGRSRDLVIARIVGIDDRNAAEALRGRGLFVARAAFPPPEAEEFYHADLIGLRAELVSEPEHQRKTVGAVAAVHDFGGGDVIEVETDRGTTIMVPFTRDVVPEVNIAGGWLLIAPLPGLLDSGAGGEDEDAASADLERSS